MKKLVIIISISIILTACSNNQAIKKDIQIEKTETTTQSAVSSQAIQPISKDAEIRQMLDKAKKAIVNEESKDLDFAISTYTDVIKMDENNGEAFYGRGTAYAMKGKYKEAAENLESGAKFLPNNTTLLVILAEVYTVLDRKEDAVAIYTKVLEIVPDSSVIYRSRASLYAVLGKTKEALENYNKSIELYPYDELAYMGRGMIFLKNQKYEEASKDYIEIINLNPTYPDAFYWLSICYYYMEKYDKTIEMITTLIECYNVENAELYNDRGDSYKKLKKYIKAIDDLTKAIKIDEKYTLAYITMAEVYAEMGNEDKVYENIENALKIDVKSKEFLTDPALKTYVESEKGKKLIEQYLK